MKRKCNGVPDGFEKEYLARYYEVLREMVRGLATAKTGESIPESFFHRMIPYYVSAIEIAKNAARYSENEDLRELAKTIIHNSTEGVAEMRIALVKNEAKSDPVQLYSYHVRAEKIINKTVLAMQNSRVTGSVECDFIFGMIPMLRGAVRLSVIATDYDDTQAIKDIVRGIVSKKEAEIESLIKLYSALGC